MDGVIIEESVVEKEKNENEEINWEEKIRKYRMEIEKEERENEERRERASKKEKSWELLRLCKHYINENGRSWKTLGDERLVEMQEVSKKQERLRKVSRKKEEMREKLTQKKLTESWLKIPEREREKFRSEEERKKRLEIKEVKENLWRWRAKKKETASKGKKEKMDEMEDKISRLEVIIEKVKFEDRHREIRREEAKKQRDRKRSEWMKKEEETRRLDEKKKERLLMKKRMEERWEMIRWVSQYIEANQENWEIEKRERDETRGEKIEQWEKAQRFQKIEILRERDRRRMERLKEENVEIDGSGWKWNEWRKDVNTGACKLGGRKIIIQDPRDEQKIENKEPVPEKNLGELVPPESCQQDGDTFPKKEQNKNLEDEPVPEKNLRELVPPKTCQKDGKRKGRIWQELTRGEDGKVKMMTVEDMGVKFSTKNISKSSERPKNIRKTKNISKNIQKSLKIALGVGEKTKNEKRKRREEDKDGDEEIRMEEKRTRLENDNRMIESESTLTISGQTYQPRIWKSLPSD